MANQLKNTKNDAADSKPRGRQTSPAVDTIKTKQAIEKRTIKNCSAQLHQSETNEKATNEFKAKIKNLVKVFIERVAITGIEDAHKSLIPAEKWMWYVAYVAACVGIIFTSANIAYQYMHPPITFDDYPIAGQQAPFPNVTICSPEQIDTNKLRNMLVVPEKVKNQLKRKNMSLEDQIQFTLNVWRLDMKQVEYDDEIKAQAACKIIDATAPKNMFRKLLDALPKCEDILFDCYFENRQFDCCEAAKFSMFDNYVCFHISMNRMQEFKQALAVIGGPLPDAVHESASGLVVKASIDWRITTSAANVTMDGFLVMLGSTASMASDPVAIPANADALITLTPPKKVVELSQCRSSLDLPKLNFYEYYDQEGVNCIGDEFLKNLQSTMGCQFGFYNYVADNGSQCSCMLALSGSHMINDFDELNDDLIEKFSTDFGLKGNDKFITLTKAFKTGGILSNLQSIGCLPLCNRWKYEVNSASYGYVNLREQTQWDRDMKNRSWSRIRIYFPESSYHLHKERKANSKYLAINNIFVQFGVYIGASMISIVQLSAYGIYVLYSYYYFRKKLKRSSGTGIVHTRSTRKLNKVHPL